MGGQDRWDVGSDTTSRADKPMKNRTLPAVAIAVILLAASLLTWWIVKLPPRANAVRQITIAQAGDFFLYAPLYIAVDAEIFKENGLDVRLVSTGGDDKTWAAVLGGSASFGVADPTFVVVSRERGQPGTVIASIVNGVPFWGVTFRTDIPPISNGHDLAGRSVATFPAPSTAFALQRKMFVDAGLEPQIREGAFGTILAMLKANTADIGLELEPNVSQAVVDNARVLYSLADVYGDFAITGLTATPELVRDDPALCQSVVCSIQQALDYVRANREHSLRLLIARFPEVKPDVARAALDRVLEGGIIPRDAVVSDAAWQKAVSLRVDLGDVQSPQGIATYVENKFAIWASQHCRQKK